MILLGLTSDPPISLVRTIAPSRRQLFRFGMDLAGHMMDLLSAVGQCDRLVACHLSIAPQVDGIEMPGQARLISQLSQWLAVPGGRMESWMFGEVGCSSCNPSQLG